MTDIRCEIRTRPSSNGLELIGLVWSDGPAAGRYDFTVNKDGPGGSSCTHQSGFFTKQAHLPATVAIICVDAATGSKYRALLSVDVAGEEVACSTRAA